MITKESQKPEQTKEEIEYEKLIEDFNKEAVNQKSKYYLAMDGIFPHLHKPFFMNFGDRLGNLFIAYIISNNYFYFVGGIPKENYEDIKPLLNKLNQNFEVEYL